MMGKSLQQLILLTAGVFLSQAQENVRITEFMASNSKTLVDEFKEASDWIEIANEGHTAVNLQNWALTDDNGRPFRWRFPATNINAGARMLIYASGRDIRTPGAPLHTSFRLSSRGGYLALVNPEGVRVTEFNPYPGQVQDVSYGFGVMTTNVMLVATDALVRVRVPLSNADNADWAGTNYNDSSWRVTPNGIGFGTTNVAEADYTSAVLPTAPVGYWTFREVSGTSVANLGTMGAGLNARVEGSGVLGTPGPRPPEKAGFASDNMGATFNGSSYVESTMGLMNNLRAFTIAGWVNAAATPGSRIGLFGQNDCLEFGFSSGFTIELWTPGGGSVQATTYPQQLNTWHHVAAVGDGSSLRVYIDGVLAASGGASTTSYGSAAYPFRIGGGGIQDGSGNNFNGKIDEVVAYHRALSAAEILALYSAGNNATAFNVMPFVKTDLKSEMLGINPSAQIRVPFVVDNPTNLALLQLRVRSDDGFVAFLNGEIVSTVNAPTPLAYNSAAVEARSAATVEELRLGAEGLLPGTNILAIQGLNVASTNEDFLLLAELTAASIQGASTVPVYFTRPTPESPNAGGTAILGPAFVDSDFKPKAVYDTNDIFVTAQVVPTFYPVTNVVMRYRVMFGAEIETPMFDDGAHGDGLAGDGTYGAVIPASASTNGQMVRWFFRAADSHGNVARWPLFTDPASTAEYLGTMVETPDLTSKLPIIQIFANSTMTNGIEATSKVGGYVAVFYDGELYDNVFMRVRGNSTTGYLKKSHRFTFNNEHPFRHLPGYPRIRHTSFVADYPDPTYMRQGLSFWLCELMGVPAPFYYPVRLQLNGQFYQMANHNDVHHEELLSRLGYDPNGALYNAAGIVVPSKYSTGGFDKKAREWDTTDADYLALANGLSENTNLAVRATNVFDMLDLPNVISYMVVARFVHENDDVWANMSLYHDNDGDDLWRVIPFDMNLSWGAIFYEGTSGVHIEGVQATNDVHKAHPFHGSSQAVALSGPGAPNNYNRLYEAIFNIPETRQMFLRRMRTMMDTLLKAPGTHPELLVFEKRMRELEALMSEEAPRDRAKWGWPAKGGQGNFDPGISLADGVDAMIRDFVDARRRHFYVKHSITNTALPIGLSKAQNAGIPLSQPADAVINVVAIDYSPASNNQAEEYISLTNGNPYAVDISGWKLSGGVDFTFRPGTVMPSNSTLYVARDLKAFRNRTTGPRAHMGLFAVGPFQGQLSARGESLVIHDDRGRLVYTNQFVGAPSLAQQYLRVSEVMYNPSPMPGNTNDAQAFEYIELINTSTSETLDLTGVRFDIGVQFSFTGSAVTALAPGARVLVVQNAAVFGQRYGTTLPVAGQYVGSLDNSGDRLRLVDARNEEILDFEYRNEWLPVTDGAGFSLVANFQAQPDAWNSRTNWTISGVESGAPGQPDTAPPVVAPVVINELLSRSVLPMVDYVELFNPNAQDVNVGGWYLTDDFGTPRKYRIATGTTIPAGGYLVLDETQFNPAGTGFAFSSKGDEVYLFSADAAGNLTGYSQGYTFDVAGAGVSFGRHTTSVGKVHFVQQRSQTSGATNAGPAISPLVITEIMYHPADLAGGQDNTDDEYIEMANTSGSDLPLFLAQYPTNTWRLRGGADFDFPTNVTLAGGARILLVDFDPSNENRLQAFVQRFQVPAGVRIFGPLQGTLNNASDRVELQRPDLLESGELAYIEMDKVEYSDDSPWPAGADGSGASLQRIDWAAYGNDPANWRAATPSIGGTFSTGDVPVIVTQPAGFKAIAFSDYTLSVAATGGEPLRYQWMLGNTSILGATNPVLQLNHFMPEQAGPYKVAVFSPSGATLSHTAVVELLGIPLNIYKHPVNAFARPGQSASFTVDALSATPLRYQWLRNAQPIPDATNRSLTLTNTQLADMGEYRVVVTDDIGPVTSQPATFQLLIDPIVVKQPQAAIVKVGSTLELAVEVTNTATVPINYRWRKFTAGYQTNTSVWSISNSIVFTNIQVDMAGTYSVVLANQSRTGGLQSSNAFVAVVDPPKDQVVTPGSNATFSVTVGNPGAKSTPMRVTYQWMWNGSNIAGATTNTLTITNVTSDVLGTYGVLVTVMTNMPTNFMVVSAKLAFPAADTDNDGMPDEWEDQYGLNKNNPADAAGDLDGDGASNLAEMNAGTDPTSAASALRLLVPETVSAEPLKLMLRFPTVSNKAYSVQYQQGLQPTGSWIKLQDIPAAGTNGVQAVPDNTPGNSQRYYRVITPPQP